MKRPTDTSAHSTSPGSPEGNLVIQTLLARKSAWKLKELADLLSCSTGKLYDMVETGRIPFFRVGNMIRFDPKATADWLMRRSL